MKYSFVICFYIYVSKKKDGIKDGNSKHTRDIISLYDDEKSD